MWSVTRAPSAGCRSWVRNTDHRGVEEGQGRGQGHSTADVGILAGIVVYPYTVYMICAGAQCMLGNHYMAANGLIIVTES